MGCKIGSTFNTILGFCNGVLREPDGTPSSTRTLLYIFSAFDMWVIWRIFYHIIHAVKDPNMLSVWLANLPMIIGALIGLAAIPYTVNRGASALSDMAGYLSQLKTGAANPKVQSAINTALAPAPDAPKPPTPAAPAVGSDGPKG